MRIRGATALALLCLAACRTTQGPGLHGTSDATVTRIQTGDKLNPFLFEFRSTPDTRVIVDSVDVPPARVWAALPTVYQALGLGITRVDEARHLIGSQQALPRGRRVMGGPVSGVLQCGRTPAGAPAADSYEVTLIVYSAVVPLASGGSEIQSLVEGRARDPISNNPAVTCSSTGALEHAIRVQSVARAVSG